MPQTPEDDGSLIKILAYMLGVVAGVGAKLAAMHKKNPITLKDIAVNSAIAFAAAFLVYSALDYWGHTKAAIVSSVICGRFADDILSTSWRSFKKWFKILDDEINNEKL
jgi:hypothetical protein